MMGWVKQAPQASHECLIPWRDGTDIGDLWRCDECRKLWRYEPSTELVKRPWSQVRGLRKRFILW